MKVSFLKQSQSMFFTSCIKQLLRGLSDLEGCLDRVAIV